MFHHHALQCVRYEKRGVRGRSQYHKSTHVSDRRCIQLIVTTVTTVHSYSGSSLTHDVYSLRLLIHQLNYLPHFINHETNNTNVTTDFIGL